MSQESDLIFRHGDEFQSCGDFQLNSSKFFSTWQEKLRPGGTRAIRENSPKRNIVSKNWKRAIGQLADCSEGHRVSITE